MSVKSTSSFHSFVFFSHVYHLIIQSHLLNAGTTETGLIETSLSTRHSHPLTIHLSRRHPPTIITISGYCQNENLTRTARWFTTRNMATAPPTGRARRIQKPIHSPLQQDQTPTARLCLPSLVRVVVSHNRLYQADPTRHNPNPHSTSCPPHNPCLVT